MPVTNGYLQATHLGGVRSPIAFARSAFFCLRQDVRLEEFLFADALQHASAKLGAAYSLAGVLAVRPGTTLSIDRSKATTIIAAFGAQRAPPMASSAGKRPVSMVQNTAARSAFDEYAKAKFRAISRVLSKIFREDMRHIDLRVQFRLESENSCWQAI